MSRLAEEKKNLEKLITDWKWISHYIYHQAVRTNFADGAANINTKSVINQLNKITINNCVAITINILIYYRSYNLLRRDLAPATKICQIIYHANASIKLYTQTDSLLRRTHKPDIIFGNWKPFKNDVKCFKIFVFTFWPYRKAA